MDMFSKFRNIADKIKGLLAEDVRPAPSLRYHPRDPWGEDDEVRQAILDVPAHGVVTFPEQLTQALAWPAQDLPALNRAANTAGNITGWIVGAAGAVVDMSRVYRAMAKVTVGTCVGAGCTLNGSFLAGNTTNTLQTITGAAWTWVAAGGATINVANCSNLTICTAEIRADQLPAGTRYLVFVLNTQCATTFSAEIICAGGAYRPTSQYSCSANLGQSVT